MTDTIPHEAEYLIALALLGAAVALAVALALFVAAMGWVAWEVRKVRREVATLQASPARPGPDIP